MRRFFDWLVHVLSGEALIQMLALIPGSYILAQVGDLFWHGWRWVMFDTIPPLFWPILAVLSLLVLIPHGFILPAVRLWKKWKEEQSGDAKFRRLSGYIQHELKESNADILSGLKIVKHHTPRFDTTYQSDRIVLQARLSGLKIPSPSNLHDHKKWLSFCSALLPLSEEGNLRKARKIRPDNE